MTDKLVQDILQKARYGIHQQNILESFRGIATQKNIKKAITQAKKAGMYPVPTMYNFRFGIYYQYDG